MQQLYGDVEETVITKTFEKVLRLTQLHCQPPSQYMLEQQLLCNEKYGRAGQEEKKSEQMAKHWPLYRLYSIWF